MSTKTTIKRIALVAVSALGFGMVSTVAPANAAVTVSSISVGTIPAARAGALMIIPVTVNYTSAGTESITVAAKVTAAPLTGGPANAASVLGVTVDGTNKAGAATLASNVLFWSTAAGAYIDGNTTYTAGTSGTITAGRTYMGVYKAGTTTPGNSTASADGVGGVASTATSVATASTDSSKTFYLAVRPDLVGSYSILVSSDGGAGSGHHSYVAGDVSTTISFTTAGAPASATLTNVGGATTHSGSYGALYRVSFKDAAGNATTLAGDEGFTITPTAAKIAKATVSSGAFSSVGPSATTAVSFGTSDLVNGVGYLNVLPSAAASSVVLSGAGTGTLSTSVTATASFTSAAAAATGSGTITFAGAASANNVVTTGWVGVTRVIPTTSTSDTIELTRASTTAAQYGYLTIVDTNGLITGSAQGGTPLRYDRAYSMAAAVAYATVTVAHAACTTGTCYNVTPDNSASDISGNVTSAASAVGSGTTTVLSPASSLRLATGGSVTYSVSVRDQFRNLLPSTAVTISFSGRNSAKTSVVTATNASGVATYTFTDAGTAGTSDTITFTASGSNNTSATITYGTTTAGSVIVSTPSTNAYNATTTTPGADKYPQTFSEISAGDGAEVNAVSVYALVKDANAVALAGVPVTFSVSGTGCAVPSNYVTAITDATGLATSSLYAWLAGTCVVTATSGGKSASANSYWSQTGAAESRSLSATVSGNSIIATVKDRFGNTIAGVPLKANRVSGSGTGGFGGSSSATGTTDSNGQVVFDVTGGAASVKIGFNPGDGTDLTYGQTDALKGLLDGTNPLSAFTAYTAGTALVGESGVGSTYDAAGVNSVTVDVAATSTASDAVDAANEATDAANAATDAANAAAEAADAATAAAQDAQAAVAALAAQVADLIAGLKAQITALTNLVVKIQKKVKA